MNQKIQALYTQLAADGYDVGDIQSFSQKMIQPEKAKALYNAISGEYDLGDFNSFYSKLDPNYMSPLQPTKPEKQMFNLPERPAKEEQHVSYTDSELGKFQPTNISLPKVGITSKNTFNTEAPEYFTGQKRGQEKYAETAYEAIRNDPKASTEQSISMQQKEIDREIEELQKQIPKSKASERVAMSGMEGFQTGGITGMLSGEAAERYQNLQDAKLTLTEAEKIMNAPKKQGTTGVQRWGIGVKDELSNVDLWTMGMSAITRNMSALEIAKKLEAGQALRPDEEALLDSFATLQYANLLRKEDLSGGYQGGRGTVEMAKFVAELAVAGRLGRLATKGTEKALVKAIASRISNKLGAKALEVGTKILTRTAAAGIGGLIGPSTFESTTENLFGQAYGTFDQDGKLKYQGRQDAMTGFAAYVQGWADTAIEYATEMSGGSVGVIGKIFRNVPGVENVITSLAKTKVGRIGRMLGNNPVLRQVGVHGFFGEWNEEFDGAVARHLLGMEDFRESFWNWDAQATLFYTLAPMSGFSAGVNMAQNAQLSAKFKKSEREFTDLLLRNGYSQQDIDELKVALLDASPEELGDQLRYVVGTMQNGIVEKDGKKTFNEEIYGTVLGFAIDAARWNAFTDGFEARLEDYRQQAANFVQENVNPDMGAIVYAKVNGQPVQLTKGNVVYNEDGTLDRDNSTTEVYYRNEAGEIQVAKLDAVAELLEVIPVEQAKQQAADRATQPIINAAENESRRPYEVGEKVAINIEGMRVQGEITGTTEAGYSFRDMTGQEIQIEPRQIIEEDNLQGVDNGVEVEYTINGQVQRGIVEDFYQYQQQGAAIIDGEMVPLTNIIGVAKPQESSNMSESAPENESAPAIGDNIMSEIQQNKADEERLARIKEDDAVKEKLILEAQIRLNLPSVVSVSITDDTEITLDKIDNREPVTNEYIKKASDELYAEYKRLENLKNTDKREFTIEQIESMQEILGEEINKLENYATRQKEEGKFINEIENSPAAEGSAAEDIKSEQVDSQIPTYPLNKSGEYDFDNFTPEQLFTYTRDNVGEQEAIDDVNMSIRNIQSEIDKKKKGFDKLDMKGRVKVREEIKKLEADKAAFEALLPVAEEAAAVAPEAIQQPISEESPAVPAEQPQQEVKQKKPAVKNKNGTSKMSEREKAWGDPLDSYEAVMRYFTVGGRIKWSNAVNDNGAIISKGLGAEYRFSNKERLQRFGLIKTDAPTPEQLAHMLWEDNQLTQFENLDTQDWLSIIHDVMNVYTSKGQMITAINDMRSKPSKEEQAYIDELKGREMAQIVGNLDDDVFADVLGISNFTPEELNELQQFINEEYGTTTGTQGAGSRNDSQQSSIEPDIEVQGDRGVIAGQPVDQGGVSRSDEAADRGSEGGIDQQIQSQSPELNPTQAQKEAGNYKKAHITVQGFDITIENPKGSTRSGVDADGNTWESIMRAHYGYFKGTKGKDGDQIDVFIGDNTDSDMVFIVDQNNPETGEFDESKVMLGFNTAQEARAAYESNYNWDWEGFRAITPVSVEDFKKWLYDGARQRKPFSEYSDIKKEEIKKKESGVIDPVPVDLSTTEIVKVNDKYYTAGVHKHENSVYRGFLEKEGAKPVKLSVPGDYFYYKWGNEVVVSEARTGVFLGKGNNLSLAKMASEERIAEKGGIEVLEKTIQRHIKDFGLSPRYAVISPQDTPEAVEAKPIEGDLKGVEGKQNQLSTLDQEVFNNAKEQVDNALKSISQDELAKAKEGGLGISAMRFARKFVKVPDTNQKLYDAIYNYFFDTIKNFNISSKPNVEGNQAEVKSEEQPPKGFRFLSEEETKKMYHHTGEKALANDLYSNFEGVSRAEHRYEEFGLKKNINIQGRNVEATMWWDGKKNDQPRISYQYTDSKGNNVKQTLLLSGKKVLNGGAFQFNKVNVKTETVSTPTPVEVLADYPELQKVDTSEQKVPTTVRELADYDAEEQKGYLSGMFFSGLEKGSKFKVARKDYEVTQYSKPKKVEFVGKKGNQITYDEITIRIKELATGKTITTKLIIWPNGYSQFTGVESNQNHEQLSRDIEGDINIDLINEYNRFHDKSDSFNIIQKALNKLNQELPPIDNLNAILSGEKVVEVPEKAIWQKTYPEYLKENLYEDITDEEKEYLLQTYIEDVERAITEGKPVSEKITNRLEGLKRNIRTKSDVVDDVLRVDDRAIVKGKNGNPDMEGSFRGWNGDNAIVWIESIGAQLSVSREDVSKKKPSPESLLSEAEQELATARKERDKKYRKYLDLKQQLEKIGSRNQVDVNGNVGNGMIAFEELDKEAKEKVNEARKEYEPLDAQVKELEQKVERLKGKAKDAKMNQQSLSFDEESSPKPETIASEQNKELSESEGEKPVNQEDVKSEIAESFPKEKPAVASDFESSKLKKAKSIVGVYNGALPQNTKYVLNDSYYAGEGNYQSCMNCGKPIVNIGVVEDENGKKHNVGMDCAKKLIGIQDDEKLTQHEESFRQATNARKAINNLKKKGEVSKIKVSITNNGDVALFVKDKDDTTPYWSTFTQEFVERYLPEYFAQIDNKEKIGFEPKIKSSDFDLGEKITLTPTVFKEKYPDGITFKKAGYEIRVTPSQNIAPSGQVNAEIKVSVFKDGGLLGERTTYMTRDIQSNALAIVHGYEFNQFSNSVKEKPSESIDLQKQTITQEQQQAITDLFGDMVEEAEAAIEDKEQLLSELTNGEVIDHQDFGEKIGGAKKDMGITRAARDNDSMPAWRRKYSYRTISNQMELGKEVDTTKPFLVHYGKDVKNFRGKETIYTILTQVSGGAKKSFDYKVFTSAEEAEAYIPVYEAYRQGFRVRKRGNEFVVTKVASTGKVLEFDKFATEKEALDFLDSAEGATSVLNRKREDFSIPALEKVERTGKDWRDGKDVTTDQLMETFGFRGGEFGNWVKPEERRAMVNMAYDAFMDLSDILGVSPQAISLGGNLSIAFGARGTMGASAHYEPNRAVINLTRMNGAGSVAHEWAHAVDNYFGLQTAKKDYSRDEKGELKTKRAFRTEGVLGTGMRRELAEVFDRIVEYTEKKKVTQQKGVEEKQTIFNKYQQAVNREAESLVEKIKNGVSKYKYNRKTKKYETAIVKGTPEQVEQVKELLSKIAEGTTGKFKWESITGNMLGDYAYINDEIRQIEAIYKNIFGQTGLKRNGAGFYNVAYYGNKLNEAKIELDSAIEGAEETITVPTDFITISKKFDRTRVEPYFQKKVELFARAFEGFIVKELEARGIKSDFLQYNKAPIYDEYYGANPYPQGEELAELSRMFREFFNTIEEESGALFKFVSPNGFYSTVETALEAIQQEKGTRDQFKAMLLKNGAKQAEMDWMGFDELPEKLTKADIQNWIDENRIEVQEVEKDSAQFPVTKDDVDNVEQDQDGVWIVTFKEEAFGQFEYPDAATADEAINLAIRELRDSGMLDEARPEDRTKFSGYQLPGGENYKELLLTMPEGNPTERYYVSKNLDGSFYVIDRTNNMPLNLVRYNDFTQASKIAENQNMISHKDGNTFRSSHFSEPNILAHVRFNERTVNGERVLFVEELQADKGQEWQKLKKLIDSGKATQADIDRFNFIDKNFPFNKTSEWLNLAARRIIRYAAENGFDRIAWTNGEQQAERYDLSKQVDEIIHSKLENGKTRLIVRKNGEDAAIYDAEEKEIESYVGKDIAGKIINGEGEVVAGGGKSLSGLDIKVGGAGMKAFYDGIVPAAMSKLGKPFGVKVEEVQINLSGEIDAETGDISNAKTSLQQSLPINDTMRNSALQGIPLFQLAYHGSPHSFDKFTLDKVGTGEGLQAYGWGLYFTDKESIARDYAKKLGDVEINRLSINGMPIYKYGGTPVNYSPSVGGVHYAAIQENILINESIFKEDKSKADIFKDVQALFDEMIQDAEADMEYDENYWKERIIVLNRYYPKNEGDIKLDIKSNRNIYTVKIHGDKTSDELNFMRWDDSVTEAQIKAFKNISEEIINKEKDFHRASELSRAYSNYDFNNKTGEDIYNEIVKLASEGRFNLDKKYHLDEPAKIASLLLLEQGVDGIKYPTNYLSSGKHEVSFNYVVFDESAVGIENHTLFQLSPRAMFEAKTLAERHKIAQEIVSGIEQMFPGVKPANVVGSNKELAQALPRYSEQINRFRVGGVFINGTVFINSEVSNTPEKIAVTWLHENVHSATIYEFSSAEINKMVDDLQPSDYTLPESYKSQKLTKTQTGYEILAHEAEKVLKTSSLKDIADGNIDLSLYPEPIRKKLEVIFNTLSDGRYRSKNNRKGQLNDSNVHSRAAQGLFKSDGTTDRAGKGQSGRVSDIGEGRQGDGQVIPPTITIDGVERQTTNSKGKLIHSTEEGIRNFWRWFGDSKAVDAQGRPLVVYHGTKRNFDVFDINAQQSNPYNGKERAFFFSDNNSYYGAGGYAMATDSNTELMFKSKIRDLKRIEHDVQRYIRKDININTIGYNISVLEDLLHDGKVIGSDKSDEYDVIKAKDRIDHYWKNRKNGGILFDDIFFKIAKDGIYFHEGASIIPAYIKIIEPKIENFEGAFYDYNKIDSFIKDSKSKNKDGIIIYDIDDPVNIRLGGNPSTDYIVFSPSQIKSATGNSGEFSEETDNILFKLDSPTPESEMLDAKLNKLQIKIAGLTVSPSIMQEAYQDKHLPVRNFIDYLKETGLKVDDFNDWYKQSTHLPGKIDAQLEIFERNQLKQMITELDDLIKQGHTYRDVENYVLLKHGLERNEWMRNKEAEAEVEKTVEKPSIRELEDDMGWEAAEEYAATVNQKKEDALAKLADKDYSGITAIIDEVEMSAEDYIAQFENKSDTSKLWSAINAATGYSLDKALEGQIINRKEYDELKARYKYYVPLRGFDKEIAEDRWDYTPDTGTYYVMPLIKAKGRTSRSETPFAFVWQMAQTTITSANRNLHNLAIKRLAEADGKRYSNTGLMTVSRAWYERVSENEWELRTPVFSEDSETYRRNIDEFEERMKRLEEEGFAKQRRGKLDTGLFIKPRQAAQHEVIVRQNGEEFIIYFNGNPRVAQAINGVNAIHNQPNAVQQVIRNATRMMAANFTVRNPLFVAANFLRDYNYASSTLLVKEGVKYEAMFQKNIPAVMGALQRAIRGKGDMTNQMDIYAYEYLVNGGRTGYSSIMELQRVQKRVERALKNHGKEGVFHAMMEGLKTANEFAENLTRLSVYVTSRQMGKSVIQSISDAKEVTVNFNRSGSGRMGGNFFKNYYLFFNASIQALANHIRIWKGNPAGMAALTGAYALSGFIAPILIVMMSGDEGEEEYMKLSDWERHTNFCIYTGKGFIKIPIAHELRVYHTMGDLAYQLMMGYITPKDAATKTVLAAADLIPANPMGATEASWAELSPDLAKPFAQLITNTSFMGTRIYDKYKVEQDIPGFRKVRVNKKGEPMAPEFLVRMAEGLHYGTGGDGVRGGISYNPDVLQHIMRGYFGGLYTIGAQTAEIVNKSVQAVETGEFKLKVRETPLRAFYASASDLMERNSRLNAQYYKIKEKNDKARKWAKDYIKQAEKGDISFDNLYKKLEEIDYLLYEGNEYNIGVNDFIKEVSKLEKMLDEVDPETQKLIEAEILTYKKDLIEFYQKVTKASGK